MAKTPQKTKALLSVEAALDNILNESQACGTQKLPLHQAAGRILAQNVEARRTHPPFAASSMDGYAVKASDIKTVPARLKLNGEAAAGNQFHGTLVEGEAVRIFTGAPLPNGADTIAIQENVNPLTDGFVEILESAPKGKFVRPKGLDFNEGDLGLTHGRYLDANAISLAASMNHAALSVYKRPKIAILATGSELVQPGENPKADQIIASNSFGIAQIIRENGGEPLDMGIIEDDLNLIKGAMQEALDQGADVIVTLGGASVGDYDLVHPAFIQLGAEFAFWKVAMRPGKPLMYGTILGKNKKTPTKILGLPGNPVSSLVCALVYLKPLVLKLSQLPYQNLERPAICTTALMENHERQDYMRAFAKFNQGQIEVTPFRRQDSSQLKTLSEANCLLIRPPFAQAEAPRASCKILPIGLSLGLPLELAGEGPIGSPIERV